jgi:ornithine decarboxylase
MDVDLLTFDCKEELKKISLYHEKASLILRIKVDDSKSICKFSCKFGADLSEVDEVNEVDEVDELMKFAKYNGLNIVGVSFHVGSNCKDVDTFYNAIKNARSVFDIGKKLGFDMTILDIGGGFPGTDDTAIKFEDIAGRIIQAIDDFFSDEHFSKLEIIAEPGRFFSAASHTLVLNVIGKKKHIYKKENGDKETTFSYTLNDGVYGSFNCIMFDHARPVIKPYNERDGDKHKSTVFGPTCDSIDTISKETLLPDLAIGEKVFVESFGAYTTAAATTFNGFQPTKCVYVIRNPDE